MNGVDALAHRSRPRSLNSRRPALDELRVQNEVAEGAETSRVMARSVPRAALHVPAHSGTGFRPFCSAFLCGLRGSHADRTSKATGGKQWG
jgi:hypothetical protein